MASRHNRRKLLEVLKAFDFVTDWAVTHPESPAAPPADSYLVAELAPGSGPSACPLVPATFLDSVTKEIMTEPVCGPNGETMDRRTAEAVRVRLLSVMEAAAEGDGGAAGLAAFRRSARGRSLRCSTHERLKTVQERIEAWVRSAENDPQIATVLELVVPFGVKGDNQLEKTRGGVQNEDGLKLFETVDEFVGAMRNSLLAHIREGHLPPLRTDSTIVQAARSSNGQGLYMTAAAKAMREAAEGVDEASMARSRALVAQWGGVDTMVGATVGKKAAPPAGAGDGSVYFATPGGKIGIRRPLRVRDALPTSVVDTPRQQLTQSVLESSLPREHQSPPSSRREKEEPGFKSPTTDESGNFGVEEVQELQRFLQRAEVASRRATYLEYLRGLYALERLAVDAERKLIAEIETKEKANPTGRKSPSIGAVVHSVSDWSADQVASQPEGQLPQVESVMESSAVAMSQSTLSRGNVSYTRAPNTAESEGMLLQGSLLGFQHTQSVPEIESIPLLTVPEGSEDQPRDRFEHTQVLTDADGAVAGDTLAELPQPRQRRSPSDDESRRSRRRSNSHSQDQTVHSPVVSSGANDSFSKASPLHPVMSWSSLPKPNLSAQQSRLVSQRSSILDVLRLSHDRRRSSLSELSQLEKSAAHELLRSFKSESSEESRGSSQATQDATYTVDHELLAFVQKHRQQTTDNALSSGFLGVEGLRPTQEGPSTRRPTRNDDREASTGELADLRVLNGDTDAVVDRAALIGALLFPEDGAPDATSESAVSFHPDPSLGFGNSGSGQFSPSMRHTPGEAGGSGGNSSRGSSKSRSDASKSPQSPAYLSLPAAGKHGYRALDSEESSRNSFSRRKSSSHTSGVIEGQSSFTSFSRRSCDSSKMDSRKKTLSSTESNARLSQKSSGQFTAGNSTTSESGAAPHQRVPLRIQQMDMHISFNEAPNSTGQQSSGSGQTSSGHDSSGSRNASGVSAHEAALAGSSTSSSQVASLRHQRSSNSEGTVMSHLSSFTVTSTQSSRQLSPKRGSGRSSPPKLPLPRRASRQPDSTRSSVSEEINNSSLQLLSDPAALPLINEPEITLVAAPEHGRPPMLTLPSPGVGGFLAADGDEKHSSPSRASTRAPTTDHMQQLDDDADDPSGGAASFDDGISMAIPFDALVDRYVADRFQTNVEHSSARRESWSTFHTQAVAAREERRERIARRRAARIGISHRKKESGAPGDPEVEQNALEPRRLRLTQCCILVGDDEVPLSRVHQSDGSSPFPLPQQLQHTHKRSSPPKVELQLSRGTPPAARQMQPSIWALAKGTGCASHLGSGSGSVAVVDTMKETPVADEPSRRAPSETAGADADGWGHCAVLAQSSSRPQSSQVTGWRQQIANGETPVPPGSTPVGVGREPHRPQAPRVHTAGRYPRWAGDGHNAKPPVAAPGDASSSTPELLGRLSPPRLDDAAPFAFASDPEPEKSPRSRPPPSAGTTRHPSPQRAKVLRGGSATMRGIATTPTVSAVVVGRGSRNVRSATSARGATKETPMVSARNAVPTRMTFHYVSEDGSAPCRTHKSSSGLGTYHRLVAAAASGFVKSPERDTDELLGVKIPFVPRKDNYSAPTTETETETQLTEQPMSAKGRHRSPVSKKNSAASTRRQSSPHGSREAMVARERARLNASAARGLLFVGGQSKTGR